MVLQYLLLQSPMLIKKFPFAIIWTFKPEEMHVSYFVLHHIPDILVVIMQLNTFIVVYKQHTKKGKRGGQTDSAF